MNQLPFSVYDFFGYLASGALLIAGITASFAGYQPLQGNPGLLIGLLLIIISYILGQIIGNLAGDLLERRIVARRLHRPTDILLGFHLPRENHAKLFPGYCTPLPKPLQETIRARANGREGEYLFFHCHALMKSDSVVRERLETFLNLYGFCRNMALALLGVAGCLLCGLIVGSADTGPTVGAGWWLAAALLGAVGMFYRYLKFYRQYALELFTSYAERSAE